MMWGQIKNNVVKSKCGKHEIFKFSNQEFALYTDGALIIRTARLRDAKAAAK